MRVDNSHHLIASARRRREQTQDRARQALQELARGDQPVTIAAVAARAGVSRAWLYAETELRQQVQATTHNRASKTEPVKTGIEPGSQASLRQRLTLAHERIRQLAEDNQQLRDQIAHLHGQLRIAKLGSPLVADNVHNTNQQPTTLTRSSDQR